MKCLTEPELLFEISQLVKQNPTAIISVDGRCGSGKTTLSKKMKEVIGAQLVHADDFFLTPFMRTKERLDTPGENIDHERLEKEVLLPFSDAVGSNEHKEISFLPYVCSLKDFGKAKQLRTDAPLIVEGSYSQHLSLLKYYDLKIFVDCSSEIQLERLKKREGEEKLHNFVERWIPLEEKYFKYCKIKENADILIVTG